MIDINSVTITTPSTFKAGILDISDSWRTARGTLKKEIIATKRKLELSWAKLTSAQLSTLLGQVSANFFSVTYPDPETGAPRTGTFYAGDKNCETFKYNGGNIIWKNVTFNLIEQ